MASTSTTMMKEIATLGSKSSKRGLDDPMLSRLLLKSPPSSPRKNAAGSLYYRSSKGMMNSGLSMSNHRTSSHNATWGDFNKNAKRMLTSSRGVSSTKNSSWPAQELTLDSRASCHGKVESSAYFNSRRNNSYQQHNHLGSRRADSSYTKNKLDQGVEELLQMLKSSNFVGTVHPKYHAPYVKALDDFESKVKKEEQDCSSDFSDDEVSIYESVVETSFAAMGNQREEQRDTTGQTHRQPSAPPATITTLKTKAPISPLHSESPSCSSTTSSSKRSITIVYDNQFSSPATYQKKALLLQHDDKRLRSTLYSSGEVHV